MPRTTPDVFKDECKANRRSLREENDEGSVFSGPYDVDYFATKFGIRKDEVEQVIRESGKQAPLELEEYLAQKYNLPEDNPDQ